MPSFIQERLAKKSSPPMENSDAVVPIVTQKSVERPAKPTSPPVVYIVFMTYHLQKLIKSRQSTLEKASSLKSRQSTIEKASSVKSRQNTVEKVQNVEEAGEQVSEMGQEGAAEEYTYDPNDYPGI